MTSPYIKTEHSGNSKFSKELEVNTDDIVEFYKKIVSGKILDSAKRVEIILKMILIL